MDNKILQSFSNIIVPSLKGISSKKWRALRRLPYFEGWLHCEIFSWVSMNVSEGYSIKGFDIPAVTNNPIPGRQTWYPDLLVFSSLTQTFIWLELKVVSLARPLVNRRKTLARYRGKILETWRALCGLSLDDTLSLWRSNEPASQQLISMEIKPFDLASIAQKSKHFGAMLIVSTGLEEGTSELLCPKIEDIHENIEINPFNEFKDDWVIIFGRYLIIF